MSDLAPLSDAERIVLENFLLAIRGPVTIQIGYTNWRGEKSHRIIRPESFWFGSTEWHPNPGLMLRAFDIDKRELRDFCLNDFDLKSAKILEESEKPLMEKGMLKEDDVQWITNDNGELGVKIGDQCFFLYKGESLVYQDAAHDDGSPMMIRPVFKREFGECCYALDMESIEKIPTEWRLLIRDKKPSLDDGGKWEQMPSQIKESEDV